MFKLAERVKETTATTGTGTLTLAGAIVSFQTFLSGIGNGSSCTFLTTDGTDWEVAEGTLSGGTSLTRATILASSNAGAAVSWGVGNKTVALVHPGKRTSRLLLGAPTVASGASSIDFTGLDATYASWQLRLKNIIPATDGASLYLRVSVAAAFLAANYSGVFETIDGAADSHSNPTAAAQIELTGAAGNAANEHINCTIDVFNPGSSTLPKMLIFRSDWYNQSTALIERRGVYAYTAATTALDGLRAIMSSGNISGTAELWGDRVS